MAGKWLIGRKVVTLLRAGPGRQVLVAEAVVSLLAASITSRMIPFRRLARRLGEFVSPDDVRVTASETLSSKQRQCIQTIGWAVRSAAPWMPFRAVCLQQAMAAHAMLRRRGIASVMHFGAHRNEGEELGAHAWLDAGGLRVTGYPVSPGMAELGCFV
ncbi:lasso peptide biosynthesis B2 protein [Novosphingobium beihaiensis]|uniref:Lasso peptide biosynthesis B2 protein n=1 Tax=Novosphingobium beihaiensis TaxID=2930389 RepID=A0ABT0BVZ0_9SPHN|nr:lasso peptide biosynthesis B2 protein [Novosphingobium beihaiensis]MCJ2189113.1 lasso peptide biosynthesis B2 protein [Novosphingobium beihaiensis]